MKKIIIILLAAFVTTAASAMPAAGTIGGPHGGWHGGYYRPRVIVGGGWYSPWYGPWGGFYGYPWYAYPPTPPSKLDIQISSIRVNYADKIRSARMDKELTKQARKNIIRDLKTQRENAILDAKKNFYKY